MNGSTGVWWLDAVLVVALLASAIGCAYLLSRPPGEAELSEYDRKLSERVWTEGYRQGVADEATSHDWTGGAVQPNRANPYARKDPAP